MVDNDNKISRPAPSTIAELRNRAEECDRLAESAPNDEQRAILRFIAARWRKFADEDEAQTRDALTKPEGPSRQKK